MKLLIVDDEAPARERLNRILEEDDRYTVVGMAANGAEALDIYDRLRPDIVLLDIRMPLMDGMETARHIMAYDSPAAIIFATAYSEHALDAFEAHAVDYLLKPIRRERLFEALEAAQKTTRAHKNSGLKSLTHTDGEATRTHICVQKRGDLNLIPVKDIYYFFAEHKYITIHHKNGEDLIEESLINLEKEFKDDYVRVHRNALIAINQVTGLEKADNKKHYVTLRSCDDKIEVSRRLLPNLRRFIKG